MKDKRKKTLLTYMLGSLKRKNELKDFFNLQCVEDEYLMKKQEKQMEDNEKSTIRKLLCWRTNIKGISTYT